MSKKQIFALLLYFSIPFSEVVLAQDIVRYRADSFPISNAIEVPSGKSMIYLSGVVPSIANENVNKESLEAYGNTEAQTVNVLSNIKKQLEDIGLSLADVVKMQVFLVGGPENNGDMDFEGFMAGYTKFYNNSIDGLPLPVLSAFQVKGLANPSWRVEIEVTAVRNFLK